ncbi:inorganic phosphate transporter PiT family protein ['Osedax' symbiont bacterium Rs2_46_30_T18]|nr:inorganic phosphate transporter PiT family protein ['Osedax' symbiont bacterium Rs2_46_30_T18]
MNQFFSSYGDLLIIVATVVGFFMAWGIGANDVANAMGTSVGAKALTIKQAILVAMLFEFAGAYLAGGEVTSTIRKGILDVSYLSDSPELFVLGMISALFAAAIWLLLASTFGWPVSTTHSIIGAVVGFAAVGISVDAVNWQIVIGIAGSWIITPIIAGCISYAIFISTQKLIFYTDRPITNAKRYLPWYMLAGGLVISLVTFEKGLQHLGLEMNHIEAFIYSMIVAVFITAIGIFFINRLKISDQGDIRSQISSVEQVFAILMIATACSMAFAHGSNDVANAIGPLAAVVSVVKSGGVIAKTSALAWWILPLGGLGIIAGLAIMGRRVIATIGKGITNLTPSRGFAAELSAATTVVIASGAGLPISTTQTLVGAVLGVGMARGIAAINLAVVRNILISWVVTLPIAALISILCFYLLKFMLLQ